MARPSAHRNIPDEPRTGLHPNGQCCHLVTPECGKSIAASGPDGSSPNSFRAFQTQTVYNYTRASRPEGGNDIWERGVVHADEVLADLIRIYFIPA